MAGKDFRYSLHTILSSALVVLLVLFNAPSYAQTTDGGTTKAMAPAGGTQSCNDMNDCLNSVVQNTYQALVRINNVPEQLKNISTMALSWLANDDSKATGQLQNSFATLGSTINTNRDQQNDFQLTIAKWLFSPDDPNALIEPANSPRILESFTQVNINDLAYATLLGKPPVPKAPAKPADKPNSPLSYVLLASAANVYHPLPVAQWSGAGLGRYINYFSTTMAVESFGAYVLSNMYIENQNGNTTSETEKNLIAQASDSNWITTIASEDLGKVLRQLLMFQSQSYVLLTRLIQVEKELLAAQVMNNSLVILNNQAQEDVMVPAAKGEQLRAPRPA